MSMRISCIDCAKFKDCTVPCLPVENYLAREDAKYLKDVPLERGETLIVNTKQRYFPTGPKDPRNLDNTPDTDDNGLGQFHFEPKTTWSRVFYERAILRHSYDEIAQRLNMKRRSVITAYHAAQKRMLEIVDRMENRKRGMIFQRREKDHLTDEQIWWILHRIFGYSYQDITKHFGAYHPVVVSRKVKQLQKKFKSRYYREMAADPA